MRTSVSTIAINASPQTVWTALTDALHVARWQYGSVLSTDWSVGSPIRFTTQWQGETFEQWGTVLSFDEPTLVRYSLFAPRPDLADVPENYFTMTYELKGDDDTTTVIITQSDPRVPYASEGGHEHVVDDDEANPVLLALKDVAESISGG
jgi:uncharacterized protein YndB with AHSA1/START domain